MQFATAPQNYPDFRQIVSLSVRPVSDAEIGKKIDGKIEPGVFIPGSIALSGTGYQLPDADGRTLDELRTDLLEAQTDLDSAKANLETAELDGDDDDVETANSEIETANETIEELRLLIARAEAVEAAAADATPIAPMQVLSEYGEFTLRNGDYLARIEGRGLFVLSRGDFLELKNNLPINDPLRGNAAVPDAEGFVTLNVATSARVFEVHADMDVSQTPADILPVRNGAPVTELKAGDMILARTGAAPIVVDGIDGIGWRRMIFDVPTEACGPELSADFAPTVRRLIEITRDPATQALEAARARMHLEDLGRRHAARTRQVLENPQAAGNMGIHFENLRMNAGDLPATIDAETRRRKGYVATPANLDFPTIDGLRDFANKVGVPRANALSKTANSPVFASIYAAGDTVAETFRKVFGQFTNVTMEDIFCVKSVPELIAYVRQGTQTKPSTEFTFNAMPGYKSQTDGVFEREGIEFMIVRDSFDNYVYAWPSPASLDKEMKARTGEAEIVPVEKMAIDVGDDFMAQFMTEFAKPVDIVQVADASVREIVDPVEVKRLAYLMSAPLFTADGFKKIAVENNGDLIAIALVSNDDGQIALIPKVGQTAKAKHLELIKELQNPAPAAGPGFAA